MFIFGTTRFSLFMPEGGAWKIDHATAYKDKLYAKDRMALRMKIFQDYAMPIYAEYAKAYNYHHIVYYSKVMPDEYKTWLLELSQRYSFLLPVEVTDKIDGISVMKSILDLSDSTSVAYFRVDDDDLLSIDYMDRLSRYVKPEFSGMAVSFSKGYAARFDGDNFLDFRHSHQRFNSMGLAYVGFWDSHSKKLAFPRPVGHHETDLFIPTVVDSTTFTYVQTHHSNQDSFGGASKAIAQAELDKILLGMRPVDGDHLKDLMSHFPTLVGDVERYQQTQKITQTVVEHVTLSRTFMRFNVSVPENTICTILIHAKEVTKSNVTKSLIANFEFEPNLNNTCQQPLGLTLSQNSEIGWYKYINAGKDQLIKFEFKTPNNCELVGIGLKIWNHFDAFDIVKLSIEY